MAITQTLDSRSFYVRVWRTLVAERVIEATMITPRAALGLRRGKPSSPVPWSPMKSRLTLSLARRDSEGALGDAFFPGKAGVDVQYAIHEG
jgi:hypothetical protein